MNEVSFYGGSHLTLDKSKSGGQLQAKDVVLKINSGSFGDTLSATPTLRKLAQSYAKEIIVCSSKPFIFENNPYVKFHINADDFKDTYYEEYEVFNTFNSIGQNDKTGIEKKYGAFDIRKIHCTEIGFDLRPDELHCDYFPGKIEFEKEDREFLNTKDYVVIHIGQNWPSRTWPKDSYENLIKRLNDLGYDVALVGFDVGIEPGQYSHNKSCYDFENFNFNGVSFMNRTTLDQDFYITKNAQLCITMDTGQLHLAGCTDTEILYIGASVNPLWRAPFRNGSQDYKMTFVGGTCTAFCASDPKHSVIEHRTINSVPPLPFCLENRPSYECQPEWGQVYKAAQEILAKE
jgi:ADP-heptose:LPS heptosyltransferase